MEINKLNSLVELYFKKTEEVEGKKAFLKWLKPNKPIYSWDDIKKKIFKLTTKIESIINKGDRCLILSENRPYWLITDISIMNAGGISVPIFTTYSENDYQYILNDCKPTLIIVSNNNQANWQFDDDGAGAGQGSVTTYQDITYSDDGTHTFVFETTLLSKFSHIENGRSQK